MHNLEPKKSGTQEKRDPPKENRDYVKNKIVGP